MKYARFIVKMKRLKKNVHSASFFMTPATSFKRQLSGVHCPNDRKPLRQDGVW